MMKMYRFKDHDGHREELEIPAEELERAQALNKELVEMAAEHDEAPHGALLRQGEPSRRTISAPDSRSAYRAER